MSISPPRCCHELQQQAELKCDMHPEPGSCGDYLIGYSPEFDEYGIWVHNGPDGSAYSWHHVHFCPFCGTELPESRRDEWCDRLEELGIEEDDAPKEMLAYGWWQDAAN